MLYIIYIRNNSRWFCSGITNSKDESNVVLSVKNLSKILTRDAKRTHIFDDVNFSIVSNQKIGLLGHNGAGKSTLMKIIAGIDEHYDGSVDIYRGDLRIGYLDQEPKLDFSKSIFDSVMEGLNHIVELQKKWESILIEMSEEDCDMTRLAIEQEQVEQRLDFVNGWNIDDNVIDACKNLQCPSDLTRKIGSLSGGEKRRVALAKLLLSRPDVLLLDEPTNHLDITSVEWLEEFIKEFKGSVITVTHDRIFLESICDSIFEIDQTQLFEFDGRYSDWLERRYQISYHTDKTQIKRKKQLAKEYEFLKGGNSKNSKTTKNRATLNKIEKLKQDINKNNGIVPFIGYEPQLLIPQGQPLRNDFVLDVSNLTFIRPPDEVSDKEQCFFENLTFSISPGMVVGIVGPNGVGKTTLLKLICGQLTPTHGSINIASNVTLGYIDQSRQKLNDSHMVWQEILDGRESGWSQTEPLEINETRKIAPREYVKQFNFSGKSQEKMVGHLSGGERNRVHLAKSLINGCNVLLLDEPSNDLDMETLRKLEECMETFRGVVIVVSHDRYFLDRICTHLIAFEKYQDKVKCQWFDGNYSQYLLEKQTQSHSQKKQTQTK